jgi:REP element-mobilizing transposase RayT
LAFVSTSTITIAEATLFKEDPMPQPRYRLVDTQTTPYYHCVSRCVRRAFLFGFDRKTGKSFDHRKQWILDRIKTLSSVFAIDVCAFAIMSNHFHLVLYVDTERARQWSADEVIERWLRLYKGPSVVHRFQAGTRLNQLEQDALDSIVETWRVRLFDLSWYMRCLNEAIARMANKEDNCTGRFWEGRYRSQALLDEAALVSCMAYVDLNPIRAGKSTSLAGSEFTSIKERLEAFATNPEPKPNWLVPLAGEKTSSIHVLPIQQTDYFALVDWTGRAVRLDKRGAIPANVESVLLKLGVDRGRWVTNTQYFGSRFKRAVGNLNQLRKFADRINQKWLAGQSQARSFYS